MKINIFWFSKLQKTGSSVYVLKGEPEETREKTSIRIQVF
jgi:hypothetical protein